MRLSLARAAVLVAVASACAAEIPPAEPASSGEYLTVSGGRLFYETAGSGPTVILLHGGFGDRRMWDDQVAEFARQYRVVRYDHRGFGRSDAPTGPYSAADDLRQLLDHLGADRAHLVGNSLGGSVALDFALLEPGRVDKLVLVASAAEGFPFPTEDSLRVVAVIQAAAEQGIDQAVNLWLEHPMLDVARESPELFARVRQMVMDNGSIWRMGHWPSAGLNPPSAHRLAEIRTPTLMIIGERDTPAMRNVARQTADGIAGARFVTIPGDHLPQMESVAEFNRLVLQFLASK
jgi:pimeloyl-ACP methyl ester carboxylesterase